MRNGAARAIFPLGFSSNDRMRHSMTGLSSLLCGLLLILTAMGCDTSNSGTDPVNAGAASGSSDPFAGGQDPGAGSGGTAGNSGGGGAANASSAGTGSTSGGFGSTVGGAATRPTLVPDNAMTNCETPGDAVQMQHIEAECAFGPTTGDCKGTTGGQQGTELENSDTDVGYIEGGDYLYFDGIAMDGITTVRIHFSKGVADGTVEVRLDSPTGQLIGSLSPEQTGSWTTWSDAAISLSPSSGTHALYFVFADSSLGIISLDWFEVSGASGADAPATFHMNQVGFDTQGAKHAVIEGPPDLSRYQVIGSDGKVVWCGDLTAQSFSAWGSNDSFYSVDFTELTKPGTYRLQAGGSVSADFTIADNDLFNATFPSVLTYFKNSRADDSDVWSADASVPIIDSSSRVNAQGGWYDASGDISKYLTHLSYANLMNPQQIPLVAWALAWVYDRGGNALAAAGNASAVQVEALWGADYLVRVLDPSRHFFYTTVFDGWSGDLGARQICAFSGSTGVVNGNYQSSLREGGGMAIAALARAARWNVDGSFTSAQYLSAAEDAFDWLNTNGVQYDDDGKENIIDDYAGLMAAVELYTTTQAASYLDAARARATSLMGRLSSTGYFVADGASRPFWHGSDAGLPVVALVRYAQEEPDATLRGGALQAIQTHLDYLVSITHAVANPYGYARQPISANAAGFFMPHQNESDYWWQGENARLGSLAAAALLGASVLGKSGTQYLDLLRFAGSQLDWILGANPYDICFLEGFGSRNPDPYCGDKPQNGTLVGGIANGITGQNDDGTGIAWATASGDSCWDNWRWVEQWLPHAAWYLVAITALTH